MGLKVPVRHLMSKTGKVSITDDIKFRHRNSNKANQRKF